jgi:hypothetical protein
MTKLLPKALLDDVICTIFLVVENFRTNRTAF